MKKMMYKAARWIVRILRKESARPGLVLKRWYKKKVFDQNAEVGNGLILCARSMCKAEKQGRITIGDDCLIYGSLQSVEDGVIEIGNHTCIFERSIVGSVNHISIGNCVVISNQVHIYDNNNHPISPRSRHEMCLNGFHSEGWRWTHAESKPIVIEDDVWIGENAAILKGVTIGKGAVIACNSVVTKNVPPYTVVAGNPAKVVKEITDGI